MIDLVMYFFLILFAIAEIGVTADLIDHFTRVGYPTTPYRAITNFLLFTACWTTFFGIIFMALVAAKILKRGTRLGVSLAFLGFCLLFWVVGAALYTARIGRGVAMCWGLPALDICRKTQAAQALAWTAFTFTIMAGFAACGTFQMERDRPSAPISSTTVSVLIVDFRLERGALNSFTAQRAARLTQKI